MCRVSVIGTSCSGKTRLAAMLGDALGIPHIELDSLHWEPNWVEVSNEIMRERVASAITAPSWVIDGNYRAVRDLIWSRAEVVVWLDYSFAVVLWRSIWRTIRRVLRREECCNGNRESLMRALSRESIVLWVIQTHKQRRRRYAELVETFKGQGGDVVILRTPKVAKNWLAAIRREGAKAPVAQPCATWTQTAQGRLVDRR